MSAQVTAMGIRDGDPAVLQALVNRRGPAVLAYCEAAVAPGLALETTADAFVRFRARVLAADRPGDIDPEVALLSATRHAAATRSPRPPADGGATGLGRLLGGKARADRLPDVPTLLADRADGAIAAGDEAALEALLDASPAARSAEERFLAAEEAYRTAPRASLPPQVADRIVATMSALAVAPANGNAVPDPSADGLEDDPEVVVDDDDALHDTEPAALDRELVASDAEPAGVDPETAVPDTAEIAATRGDEVDPAPTVEWSVPADELGESPELEHEIAAARLPGGDEDAAPAHVQSASGAVAEDDVAAAPPPPPARIPGAGPPAAAPAMQHPDRHGIPGRAALVPAAAVVTLAAIGAMAASGVFGGNDPSPAVDTGIVPERALQAVPEGEAGAVVDDLRAASADARRRRLADRRRQLAAQQATPEPAAEETTLAPDEEAAPALGQVEPTTTGEIPAPETQPGEGGTSAEDATGGGTASP